LRKIFLENALTKHSFTLFFGVVIASVLNYFFHLLLGRWVSVESYGEIESLNSMINIIIVPASAISMAATRYSSGFKADGDKAGNLAWINFLSRKLFVVILPIFLIFLIFMPQVASFLNLSGSWPLFILGLYLTISLFLAINTGTLIGWKKFSSTRDLNVWSSIFKFVSGIVLVKLGFSVMGAIAGYFLGALFAYFISFRMLRFIFKENNISSDFKFDFSAVKNYIFALFLGNLALNILGNADMVLAKHNLDPVLAGQYGALTVVSKIIFFATSIIATVMFSISSENHHKKEDSTKILFNAFFLTAAASAIAAAAYFLFPELILGILFGEKYSDASRYLGWFGVLVGLFSLVNLLAQYLLSIHETKMAYGLLFISIISSFAILFTGYDIYGILKIAIISQVSGIVFSLYFIRKIKNRKQKTGFNYVSGV
jgi:O-antigen/teichoic acid export membrane protein